MAKGKVESKAAFVRGLPRAMKASAVVAKAKAAGLKLSTAYVYAIRSAGSKKGAKRAATKSDGRATSRGGAEDLLRSVAAEVGLSRAIALLQSEHDRVARLLRA